MNDRDGRDRQSAGPMHELLGSVSVFATVLSAVVEEALERAWSEKGLTLGQLRFLTTIESGAEPGVNDIARSLDMSDPAASRNVDRLVLRGLVRRRQGTDDRRTVRLSLTPDGASVLEGYRLRLARTVDANLRWLSNDELVAMTGTLDRMTRSLLAARSDDSLPCQGCRACNLFRRADCPLGRSRPHSACHSATVGRTSFAGGLRT